MSDPDILAVLNTFPISREKARVASARKRHREAIEAKLETQLELLSDEVEAFIPRAHPMFDAVVLAVALVKIERANAPKEFRSYLDEGLPNHNW